MKRKLLALLTILPMVTALAWIPATDAQAVSHQTNYYYRDSKSGLQTRYLQANVWLQNGGGKSFGYQTSAKYLGWGDGPNTAGWIKNTATISVSGIGVTVHGVSGNTVSGKSFSTTWTNTNAKISDRAGTASVNTTLYFYIVGRSEASANVPYYGSPRTASAAVTKWI